MELKHIFMLIVDDGSPDGTADIVKELGKNFKVNYLLRERKKEKLGLGTAYIHDFKMGIGKGYQFYFEMDADFRIIQRPVAIIKCLSNEGADVAIGSQYVKGWRPCKWPKDGIVLSKELRIHPSVLDADKDPTARIYLLYCKKYLDGINFDINL